MNILLIADSISGSKGGAEGAAINTKKMLEEKQHKVFLLGEKTSKEVLLSFFRRWFSLKYYFKAKKIIKENSMDIVVRINRVVYSSLG